MDLDLDSAPPIPPPSSHPTPVFTPVTTRHPAQLKLEAEEKSLCPTTPILPAITMPMVEVFGVEGPILVFRPWSDSDVADAVSHIGSPKDHLSKWEADLTQFVKGYRPTMSELRRLMHKSLGSDYHKIQGVFTPARMDSRLTHADFDNEANNGFIRAVEALVEAVRENFPLRLNLSAITSMTHGP